MKAPRPIHEVREDACRILEQALARVYPGTRWVARPVERRERINIPPATARDFARLERPGLDAHDTVTDRKSLGA